MKRMFIAGLILSTVIGAGCSGRNDKDINRDKDRPKPEEPKAGLQMLKGAPLADNPQETHPFAWVGS